jgi:hypothetical protein
MNILIVEDFRPVAKILKEMFEQLGHKVVWVIGFQDKDVQNLRAICVDGSELRLDATQFDFAFVDGEIQFGNNPDKNLYVGGPDVVAKLAKAGVSCFGISTLAPINEDMIKVGAVLASQKMVMVLALFGGFVKLENLKRPVAAVRKLLARDLKEFKSDEEFPGLWARGEELLVKHLKD